MKKEITKEQVHELATATFGLLPDLIRKIAGKSPQAAFLYTNGIAVMESASFSAMEMNAIELKISSLNHCEACMRSHSYLLKQEGLPEEDIKAVIAGGAVHNTRLGVLLQATEYIYYAGSGEYPGHVLDYLNDHLTESELYDIISLVAVKTISNYINNYQASLKKHIQPAAKNNQDTIHSINH